MTASRSEILVICLFTAVCLGFAQDNGQADISTEINTDAFQEHFFEALKQKGIENYDRAIKALLECKKLQPDNEVVDYELGLNYMKQTSYLQAQQHFEIAVQADQDNKWYKDALLRCLIKQHNFIAAVPVAEKLLSVDVDYYKTLADLYIELGENQQAQKIIDKMQSSGIDLNAAAQLEDKLLMRIGIQNTLEQGQKQSDKVLMPSKSPVDQYREQIEKQFKKTDFAEALRYSSEAIDNFPTQPIFYLYKARSLNKLQNFSMAVQILEQGLSYIIEDPEMENEFYKQYLVSYTGIGDEKKIDRYQEMIKN